MIKRSSGFTVVELLIIILILSVASVLFFIQKNNIEVAARDQQRKTSINAIYYSLEEVFFKANNYYPVTVSETNLPSVDPTLFTDPFAVKIGEADSEYRYEPVGCIDDTCTSYTLRSTLENEDDFVKESRNK